MVQVDRREHLFQMSERRAGANVAHSEAGQSALAHLVDLGEVGDRIGAVVPEARDRVGGAGIAGVAVGEEEQAGVERLAGDALELACLVGAGREFRVGEARRRQVPLPHARRIGARSIERAVRGDRHQRRRIVHHRGPVAGRGGEVVREAQGVPDLVRGKLADARESQHDRVVGSAAAAALRAQEPLEQQAILAHAQRAERDVALDDLAGAGVDHAAAVGPAAGRAMHPLDHVVAGVERVRARRQQLDPERVDEAGGLQGAGPPGGTFDERRPDRLGRPRVDVVDDRAAGLRPLGGWIHLLQPMACDPAPLDVAVERRRVVREGDRVGAQARVERAWRVTVVG